MNSLFKNKLRCEKFNVKYKNKLYFDFSRQLIDIDEYDKLIKKIHNKVAPKINDLFNSKNINFTENRQVLHHVLRSHKEDNYEFYDKVSEVLNNINKFTKQIHSGKLLSVNNKKFKNILSIGIGGSYLGIECVHNAIQYDKIMNLQFISNIDPDNFYNCIKNINADETLVIVISKTFTTQETMINCETVKNWLITSLKSYDKLEIINKHFIAISTNQELVNNYGISKLFKFWDWVGGRYSIWSAVGVLPLSLVYGYDIIEDFLNGAREADIHFKTTDPENNIPLILGALSIHNTNLGYNCRAILPYSQALNRFPAYIQQLEMESNGKTVNINGEKITNTGEIIFGESGTNGQHSFYQLLHQGSSIVPCEFIGFCKQKYDVKLDNNTISNHDELMCNMFAQADALAFGKDRDTLIKENCSEELIPYKVFEGNRPSTIFLFKELTPWTIGFLMAIYEHRVAVQGFYLDINSFDQWGVELGKILAKQIKKKLEGNNIQFNDSTEKILDFYKS